ncbi:MAG: hypothetical protein JWO62_422 [Acidimicrobiaceae bacterium]|jgi:hypothetical protein|nr:hypothetical protein [Acidimicrobiaceae bacterium]
MVNGFGDRLVASEYAYDEPIHVYVPQAGERWIPERLWFRLVSLGRAYETHLLPLLPGSAEPQTLNGQQVVNLADEIEFLISIVDDEALSSVVAELRSLFAEASALSRI